jgi:putative redox protein
MGVTERTVHSHWAGGLRAEVMAGEHRIVVDEPESVGGTGLGPQPTELLLASVASCFTIALAFCARKRGVELEDVDVAVTGRYDGPRFVAFRIAVRASGPDNGELTALLRAAERVCYVTRTLASAPTVEVVLE